MKKQLVIVLLLCLISFGLKAQTMQNFIVSPTSVPFNGTVHVDYDFLNSSSANITGTIDSHLKVNGLDLGIVNNYLLAGPLLPGQSTHIAFDITAGNGNNFDILSDNIIIIWPTGGFTDNGSDGQASVYVTNPN